MTTALELVQHWREIGPVAWAESSYGWIGEDGKPITLTDWQRAALLSWWANRETCSTLALSNVKKTGKTLLDAVLLAWRWLALPGQHFAAGNDLDQAQARSFAMIADMIRVNPYLSQVCKVGRSEITFEPTGSKLTALAVDAAGNAGANFLTTSHTEAWAIIYEAGRRAYEELTPPPGRFYDLPCLRILDSYAGYEGESETWHAIVDRGLSGELISDDWPIFRNGGLILFHMVGSEARERCYRGTPQEAEEYYREQAASLRPNAFERMHNNLRTSGEGAFVSPEQWEACASNDVHQVGLLEKLRMVIGIDASTSRDFTALVGTSWNDEAGVVDLKLVKVWKPTRVLGVRFGKPTVDLAETVDKEVFRLHKAGQIECVYVDPFQMHSSLISYQKAGITVYELAQNAGRVEADSALWDAINSRAFRHYSDPALTEAVQAAAGIETPRGYRIAKIAAGRHVDPLVALSMSHYGALKHKRTGGGGVTVIPGFEEQMYMADEGYEYKVVGTGYVWTAKGTEGGHKPGITWRNCPRRNRGCASCVQELSDEGFYERQEQDAELQADNARYRLDEKERERAYWKQKADQEYQDKQRVITAFWTKVRQDQKEQKR